MNRARLHAQVETNADGETTISLVKESEEANHVASRLENSGGHAPAVALPWPAKVQNDPRTGTSYLLIDYAMPWPQYYELLTALNKYGLVETDFVRKARDAGATFIPLLPDGDGPSRKERLLSMRLESAQQNMSELRNEVGTLRGQLQRLQAIIGETDDNALNPAPEQDEPLPATTPTDQDSDTVQDEPKVTLEAAQPC